MRRKLDAKFKAKVALEAVKERETLRALSQRYSLQSCQVQQWKKQLLTESSQLFLSKREQSSQKQEDLISELYRQIGQLKVENEFLKKTSI